MAEKSYNSFTTSEDCYDYTPRLRDDSRTQLEYEGCLPEYEDMADHYTQYRRNFNVL